MSRRETLTSGQSSRMVESKAAHLYGVTLADGVEVRQDRHGKRREAGIVGWKQLTARRNRVTATIRCGLR